jgi:chromosome segregation ATPase
MLIQEKILANPSQALVNEQRVFDAIDDFAKFSGLPGAGRYFLDPESPEGQQQKQQVDEQNKQSQEAQMKEQQAMLETQTKIADAEVQKAQAQMMNVQLKNQVDSLKAQIDNQDNMSNAELSALKQQLEEAKAELADIQKSEELAYKYWQTEFNGRLQLQLASQNDSGENNE